MKVISCIQLILFLDSVTDFHSSFIKSRKPCTFAKQIYHAKLLNFKSYVKLGSHYLLTSMLKMKTFSSYIQLEGLAQNIYSETGTLQNW